MRLTEFIHENVAQIIEEWLSFARSLDASKRMNPEELRDHAEQMLNWIAKDLSIAESDQEAIDKSMGRKSGVGVAPDDRSAQIHGAARFVRDLASNSWSPNTERFAPVSCTCGRVSLKLSNLPSTQTT